jgi:excisionase family DNA binding protein
VSPPYPPPPGPNPIAPVRGGASKGTADDELLGLPDAAAALGVHYMTAYRYVRTGVLDAHQAGGQWRVRPSAITAFRDARANRAPATRRTPPRTGSAPSTDRTRLHALADRLTAGDEGGAWRIVDHAVAAGWDPHDIYLDLIGASMQEIGDRWEAGTVTVADEHRASVVASRVMGRLGAVQTAAPGRSRGSVIVGAAPGDRHALPSALLADLLRLRGVRVVDLGADTPPEHLAEAAGQEDRLLAVGICATTPLDPSSSEQVRRAVHLVQERAGVPVLLGGRAVGSDAAGRAGADHHSRTAGDAITWFASLAPTGLAAVGSGA